MAPKKRAASKRKVEEDEDEFIDDDDDDFEPEDTPKKKRAAPKAKATPKGKRKPAAADEDDSEGDEGATKKAKPKPQRKTEKPPPPPTELTKLDDGWILDPPSLMYKTYGEPATSAKIAGFDLDDTLTVSSSGAKFMMSATDWKLSGPKVVEKLKGYHKEGYRIVVFSNQGGVKAALAGKASANVRGKVDGFAAAVGIPLIAILATMHDDNRKPSTGMWATYVSKLSGGVQPDLAASFFVGDNFDGGDKGFAEGVGLTFRTALEEFGAGPNAQLVALFLKVADVTEASNPEKGMWGAKALRKAADALKQFPKPITADVIKEVAALPGVGKKSVDYVKEFLSTGTIAAAEVDLADAVAGEGGGNGGSTPQAKGSKRREEALQFM